MTITLTEKQRMALVCLLSHMPGREAVIRVGHDEKDLDAVEQMLLTMEES